MTDTQDMTTTTNHDDDTAGIPDECPAGGEHNGHRDEDRSGHTIWVCEGCNEILG